MFPTRKMTAATLALALASVPATSVLAQDAATTAPQTQEQSQSSDQTGSTGSMQDSGSETATSPDTGSDNSTAQAPQSGMDGSGDGSGGEMQAADFDDATLDAFAAAVIDVTEIRDEYVPQLEAAENEQAQQTILAEANEKMRTAIESTDGLSVDDYMAINRAATMDEELNARIAQRINDMMDSDAG